MQISVNANRCFPSPMRKFHPYEVAAQNRGLKIYKLNMGQPDLPTPPAFYEAVMNYREKTLSYAPSPGIPTLIAAIQSYYNRMQIHLENNDILITTGGSEALLFTFLSILDPGTEVIIPEPFYPNYSTFVHAAGGVVRALPTKAENGYRYADRDKLERLITQNTRAILIVNPGNPTGVVLSKEEMRMIADVAKKHNVFLIADEVYREFCYTDSDELFSMGQFDDIAENLVLIDSASKRFSACGARIGCIITKNKLLQQAVLKFCQSRLSVATLDQVGAAALYSVDFSYFKECKEEYRHRRDVLSRKLSQIPGVKFTEPSGAFYMMVSLPVDDADKFQHWLLTEFEDNGETIMFAPGAPFYETPGKGINEVRIAYVSKEEDLERAMDLLAIALERYNNK